jgi:sugar phosphate permease
VDRRRGRVRRARDGGRVPLDGGRPARPAPRRVRLQLFLLWGVVNGLATGAVSVPLAAIIANRWFVRRRGLVTGLLTASNASGQLVFLPALAWVAGFDWRYAAALVAAVAVVVVLPVVVAFLRPSR